jgi:hypothetical protein
MKAKIDFIRHLLAQAQDLQEQEEGQGVYIGGGVLLLIIVIILLILLF